MKKTLLARAAAKALKRVAFGAIGMVLDGLDAAEAAEEIDKADKVVFDDLAAVNAGEEIDEAAARNLEDKAALVRAARTGALDKAKEIFFAEGLPRVLDELISAGILTRGQRDDVINQYIECSKGGT